jgi:Cdc25 family phosphatase
MEAPRVKFLQPAEVKCLITDPQIADTVVVLDVRDDDFSDGHIKRCVNIPCYELCSSGTRTMDDFIEAHCDRSKTSMVIVHCYLSQQRGPMAAARLAERLRQLDREGRPEVCVMAHGWRRFKQLFGDDPELCELNGK